MKNFEGELEFQVNMREKHILTYKKYVNEIVRSIIKDLTPQGLY